MLFGRICSQAERMFLANRWLLRKQLIILTALAQEERVFCREDELLMTLMRLRLGRIEQDLAYEFGVNKSTISRTFNKRINFLYLRLGDLPLWPEWEAVKNGRPKCFKESYPKTYTLVDATE